MITYVRTAEGWLYLCVVKDIVSGLVLGSSTSENMKSELVLRAFMNASARFRLSKGTIYHSDRGSQYTSKEFMSALSSFGITQSFSNVGMPGDNAWAESFFATLKKEIVHLRHFTKQEEARQVIFRWIECFYNTRRVQKRLGYLSPRNFCSALETLRYAA